jgi:hypothetical protein
MWVTILSVLALLMPLGSVAAEPITPGAVEVIDGGHYSGAWAKGSPRRYRPGGKPTGGRVYE